MNTLAKRSQRAALLTNLSKTMTYQPIRCAGHGHGHDDHGHGHGHHEHHFDQSKKMNT